MVTLEQNVNELRSRVYAMERVIGALVLTHPNLMAVAERLEEAAETVTVSHLFDAAVSDEKRMHQRALVLEYAQLAREKISRAAE